MREVSCIAMIPLFRACERDGIAPERLTEGVPYSLKHLRTRRRWIDWEAFARILANGERLWSPEQQVAIGGFVHELPDFRWVPLVSRALFSLEEMYRWVNGPYGPATRMFRCVHIDVSREARDVFRISATVPHGYEPAPMFFRISVGAISDLPRFLGYEVLRVDYELTEHGGTIELAVSGEPKRAGWLRRTLVRPLHTGIVLAGALRTAIEDFQLSEERYSKVFNLVDEAIYTLDDEGYVVDANPSACKELGYSRSELIGMHVGEFVRGRPPFSQTSLRPNRALTMRAEHVRKDGSTYPVETRAVMLPGEGRPTIYAFARNIELQERLDRVRRQVLEHTLDAQEGERRRLARDLHDSTSQSLTSILLGIKALEQELGDDISESLVERLDLIRETTHASLDDIQRLVRGLRPTVLDDLGFLAAMERLCDDVRNEHELDVDHTLVGDLCETTIPIAAVSGLYRVVQEALTNVVRHANASRVSVLIESKGDRLRIIVEDDGRGFCTETEAGGGFGLVSMRERLAMLDGKLTVESSPRAGTSVYAEIPLAIEGREATDPTPQ